MVLDAFFTFNRILEEDILNGSHRHRSFLHRHFEGDKGGLTKRTGFLLAPVADRPVDPLQLEAEHQAFLRDPDNGWDIIARDDGTSFEIFRAANPLQPRLFRAEMVVDKGKLFVKRFAPE